jgi:hypothetical protein
MRTGAFHSCYLHSHALCRKGQQAAPCPPCAEFSAMQCHTHRTNTRDLKAWDGIDHIGHAIALDLGGTYKSAASLKTLHSLKIRFQTLCGSSLGCCTTHPGQCMPQSRAFADHLQLFSAASSLPLGTNPPPAAMARHPSYVTGAFCIPVQASVPSRWD